MLKKDMVKDDETYQAEFAEQGASACQMAGTRKMDTSTRLPGLSGEAHVADSAYAQEKHV